MKTTITPLTEINSALFDHYEIQVFIKRDDLNHPQIQGNKWHKLKLNLQHALQQNYDTLITFGGAYSNHIAATAYAAQESGLKSVAYIRGAELAGLPEKWSNTLKTASDNDMELRFLTREAYRNKTSKAFTESLHTEFANAYILPEGGSNDLAVDGFASLMNDLEQQQPNWTHLYSAVGTGGTLAGLIKHAFYKKERTIQGVAVLKQADYLLPQINQWIDNQHLDALSKKQVDWQLLLDYHGGGYGKLSAELKQLKIDFETQFNTPLDPVYTVKMVAAFYQELKLGHIKASSTVILLHTGGLQGNQSLKVQCQAHSFISS